MLKKTRSSRPCGRGIRETPLQIHSGMGVDFLIEKLGFNFTGVPTLKKGLYVKYTKDYHLLSHFGEQYITVKNKMTKRNKRK